MPEDGICDRNMQHTLTKTNKTSGGSTFVKIYIHA